MKTATAQSHAKKCAVMAEPAARLVEIDLWYNSAHLITHPALEKALGYLDWLIAEHKRLSDELMLWRATAEGQKRGYDEAFANASGDIRRLSEELARAKAEARDFREMYEASDAAAITDSRAWQAERDAMQEVTKDRDAMREVVEAARRFVEAPVCCRKVMSFGHDVCMTDNTPCDLHRYHELKYALARLDGR